MVLYHGPQASIMRVQVDSCTQTGSLPRRTHVYVNEVTLLVVQSQYHSNLPLLMIFLSACRRATSTYHLTFLPIRRLSPQSWVMKIYLSLSHLNLHDLKQNDHFAFVNRSHLGERRVPVTQLADVSDEQRLDLRTLDSTAASELILRHPRSPLATKTHVTPYCIILSTRLERGRNLPNLMTNISLLVVLVLTVPVLSISYDQPRPSPRCCCYV
ncbi:hypothetical protein EI94DRAFT_645292 [Lactarius quietus]|nr:hypothetical protein EI94DRAFT_645292 [Lactarius quietus]